MTGDQLFILITAGLVIVGITVMSCFHIVHTNRRLTANHKVTMETALESDKEANRFLES